MRTGFFILPLLVLYIGFDFYSQWFFTFYIIHTFLFSGIVFDYY